MNNSNEQGEQNQNPTLESLGIVGILRNHDIEPFISSNNDTLIVPLGHMSAFITMVTSGIYIRIGLGIGYPNSESVASALMREMLEINCTMRFGQLALHNIEETLSIVCVGIVPYANDAFEPPRQEVVINLQQFYEYFQFLYTSSATMRERFLRIIWRQREEENSSERRQILQRQILQQLQQLEEMFGSSSSPVTATVSPSTLSGTGSTAPAA